MFKNVASQKLIVFAFDATANTPKTGDAANITAYVSKDYGSVTVLGDTSATEMDATNAKGYYLFDLTQAETNADTLLFSAKSSTANIVVVGAPATVFTNPANFTATSIDSSGRLDIIKINGTSQTARDIGASVLLGSGAINDAAFATTAGPISKMGIVDQGTAQAATGTTLQLRSAAAFADSELVGSVAYIVSATAGAGQSRVITAYTGATDTATVDAWTTTPTGTIVYQIFAAPPNSSAGTVTADVTKWNGTSVSTPSTAGIPEVNVKNIANAAVSTSSAQIGVNVINAAGTAWGSGAITAGSIAAAALNGKGDWNIGKTGYSLSASGITAIWQDSTAGDFTAAGSIGKSIMNGVALGTGLTVNDLTTKTGFALTAAYDPAKTASQAGDAMTLTSGERNSVADALLGRNVAGGSSAGRLVKEALYVLRNKTDIAAGTLTVYGTDDSTAAFTAAVTTTAGNPISTIDPA